MRKKLLEMGGICVPACEVGGLAHDFGHPPFGHAGEVELNRLLRENGVSDGFEGNAQTFRVLTRLARRRSTDGSLGLNLCAVSLAAVLKYPYACPDADLSVGERADKSYRRPPKFGAYRDDVETFRFVMDTLGIPHDGLKAPRRSPEASIMDLADDIAYAYHDLEDLYKEGAFDFNEIVEDLSSASNFLNRNGKTSATAENAFVSVADKLKTDFGGYFDLSSYIQALNQAQSLVNSAGLTTRYDGSPTKAARVDAALSYSMKSLFQDIIVDSAHPQGPVILASASWHHLQPLKTITKRYVVETAPMGQLEFAQARVIRELYQTIIAWLATAPKRDILPEPLASFLLESGNTQPGTQSVVIPLTESAHRAVADYICTLGDEEAFDRYRWLLGHAMPHLREAL